MNQPSVVLALVEELEEVLEGEDCIPLYQFAWNARGLRRGLDAEDIPGICEAAYDELSQRHAFTRQWFRWPITDLSLGWPVEEGTPLDFDLDPDQDVSVPLQVLVPDD
jgi:hypothetical protein